MEISKSLRAWRIRAGLTQTAAAARFGVKIRQYQNWEAGTSGPRGLTLRAVEKAIAK
jgi:transcriptional regulator with XRE-family HTH domain